MAVCKFNVHHFVGAHSAGLSYHLSLAIADNGVSATKDVAITKGVEQLGLAIKGRTMRDDAGVEGPVEPSERRLRTLMLVSDPLAEVCWIEARAGAHSAGL